MATCSLSLLVIAALGAAAPIPLRPGSHLLIDDHLISQSSGLVRTTHQPEKLPEPILPKDPGETPLFFHQVQRDPKTGRFRMWYNSWSPDKRLPFTEIATKTGRAMYSYAESKDGIRWLRPSLGIVEIEGSRDNNIFWNDPAYGLFFVDEGAGSGDPSRRYKFAYYTKAARGISIAFSADGLHFKPWPGNPALPEWSGRTGIGDIIDGCWDPIRGVYLATVKAYAVPEDGYKGSTMNAREGYRRLVGQTTSRDFIHWQPPKRIVVADPKEPGVWEFYGAKPYVRGDLYIAFLRVLRDDIDPATGGPIPPTRQAGIGWTELMTSRDGENWTRHREPFLDRDKRPGAFDHAMAWFGDWVTVGDQEYIYYGGYSAGHKIGSRDIGLAKLRKNGFVSRDARSTKGLLRTPTVLVEAARMTINAKVDGELRVRIVDAAGKSLPGFDWTAVLGDSVAHPVRWKGALSSLKGKPVQLEFALRQAQLYGFDLE